MLAQQSPSLTSLLWAPVTILSVVRLAFQETYFLWSPVFSMDATLTKHPRVIFYLNCTPCNKVASFNSKFTSIEGLKNMILKISGLLIWHETFLSQHIHIHCILYVRYLRTVLKQHSRSYFMYDHLTKNNEMTSSQYFLHKPQTVKYHSYITLVHLGGKYETFKTSLPMLYL